MTLRVFLVEDDPDVRRSIRRRLRPYGYEVREAGSVLEATGILDAGARFDAALIDWNLGNSTLTGLVIAKRLRKEQPECARVIMSGHSTAEMRAEWEDPLQAILAFVAKPINFDGERGDKRDSLLEILRRVERSRQDTPPHGTPIA